jgi:hypothetical protein
LELELGLEEEGLESVEEADLVKLELITME